MKNCKEQLQPRWCVEITWRRGIEAFLEPAFSWAMVLKMLLQSSRNANSLAVVTCSSRGCSKHDVTHSKQNAENSRKSVGGGSSEVSRQ